MDFQIWIVLLGLIVLGILFYFKFFRPKERTVNFELVVDAVCKEYSFENELLGTGRVRVYRKKGDTIIYDKVFSSISELRKEFPKR
jgi:hypothetical protein